MNVVMTTAVYTRLPVSNSVSDLIATTLINSIVHPQDRKCDFGNGLGGASTCLHFVGDVGRMVESVRPEAQAEAREPSDTAMRRLRSRLRPVVNHTRSRSGLALRLRDSPSP